MLVDGEIGPDFGVALAQFVERRHGFAFLRPK
jgi:hypothetical protein